VTNLHQLTPHCTASCPQHGGRNVAIDYCDVISPYLYASLKQRDWQFYQTGEKCNDF